MRDLLIGAVVREGVRHRLEADHQRGRLPGDLRHQPGAAPVGSHAAIDPGTPQIGSEVGLEHLVGHRHPGPDGDLRHPGEFVVEIPHVAGQREDSVPRLAQRLADGDQLVGRRGGPRRQLAVLGPMEDGARRRCTDGTGLDGLAHQRCHLGDLLAVGRVVGAALTEDVGAQRTVRDEGRHVEHAFGALHLVEVLAEGLPIPVHALGQGRARYVLHALHQLDQPGAVRRAGRGEPNAAIAHHDRGHPVPARRRDLRVPGDLAVIVGVDVHPAGRDEKAVGLNDAPGRSLDLAHRGDDAPVDGDVTRSGRTPRSVGDGAAADDQVVHGAPPRVPLTPSFAAFRSW